MSQDHDIYSSLPEDEHWFWGVIKKSWKLYLEVILATALINIFALVTPLFVMNVYDRVVPNQAIETLWVLASGVAIIMLFDFVIKTLRNHFIDTAGKRADILLSSRIFRHVIGIKMSDKPESTGSFANNLQEFESFREFFTSSTLATLIDLPFVVIFLLVIYSIGHSLAYIPLTAIPVIIITGLTFQIPLKRLINRLFSASARKHASLIETLSGIETVKILGGEEQRQKQWESDVGTIAQLGQKSRILTMTSLNLAMLVQQISYIGVVILGVYHIGTGDLTIGGLIACTILTGRSLAPMNHVATLLTRYQQSRTAYQTLDRIFRMPVERPRNRTFLDKKTIDGSMEFRDVGFTYPGQPVTTLNNLSFKINEGEHVGFVGRIGSGKTTIQKLIMGLYEPDNGSILIDNTDMRQLDPAVIRRAIGYVPQDIRLFQGTIRDNLSFGVVTATDDDIMSAAEISGLSEFLRSHPNGLDYKLGENGSGLSGGQRQMLSITRALLLDPPVFIFDEPTNSLDSSTEEKLKNNLAAYLKDKTVILVTHKASPLSLVDRLIVVDGGGIVADGKRDQVIQALAGNQVNTRMSQS